MVGREVSCRPPTLSVDGHRARKANTLSNPYAQHQLNYQAIRCADPVAATTVVLDARAMRSGVRRRRPTTCLLVGEFGVAPRDELDRADFQLHAIRRVRARADGASVHGPHAIAHLVFPGTHTGGLVSRTRPGGTALLGRSTRPTDPSATSLLTSTGALGRKLVAVPLHRWGPHRGFARSILCRPTPGGGHLPRRAAPSVSRLRPRLAYLKAHEKRNRDSLKA